MIVYDMIDSNTPHLLIAGETGSGKSSMVRVVLSTLIQYMTPDKLHLYLGDLKTLNFIFTKSEACKRGLHGRNRNDNNAEKAMERSAA